MILLDSVSKQYAGDPHPALDSVSLHIEPNEFVFLVGKSGAGKSSLIKMITKEEVPDSGKIIVGGIDLDYVKKRHIPGYRRRLGVVFQDFKLLPRRTVYENVAFALEIAGMSGKEIRKTVPKVLELVDLLDQAKKFPDQLSGGQQQRVSIARSVARQPKILIADEPTANLDKLTTAEIIALLKKINDFGTTILVSTHDESVVNTLQKRVVTLKDGRIVNDQKNNGVYELSARAIPKAPVRVVQSPGYALRRPQAAVQGDATRVDDVALKTSVASSRSEQSTSVNAAAQKTVSKPRSSAAATNRTRPVSNADGSISVPLPRQSRQSSMRKMEVKSSNVSKKAPVKMSAAKGRVL